MNLQDIIPTLRDRIVHNFWEPLWDMPTQKWFRVFIIVCAYLLLRPYLVKAGSKQAMMGHEEASAAAVASSEKKKGAKKLGDMVDIPEDTDEEDDGEGEKATAWGTKARTRQRRVVRKILEAEEKRIEGMVGDDDKDIEEFLED